MEITIDLELLAEVLNKQPGELSEALTKKEDDEIKPVEKSQAKKYIKEAFSEHVQTVKRELRDEGYGRGKKEALSNLEKSLAEKYGVDVMEAEKMIDKIVEEKTKVKADDPDKIKQSEVYINDIRAEIEKREKIESDFNEFKTNVDRHEQQNTVKSKIDLMLEENNFVLPEKPLRREKLKKALYREILDDSETKFEIDDQGIRVLNKDGKPKRNDNLKELNFKDYTLSVAKTYFDIAEGDGRNSPGNKNGDGSAGGSGAGGEEFQFPKIESREKGMQHLYSIKDIEEKKAFNEYLKELEKAGSFET